MRKIIYTRGLPASGKTTWAKEFIKENPNYKIVCRDDLRSMLDNGEWSKHNEKTVLSVRDKIVFDLITSGRDVIIADTNLVESTVKRIKELAEYIDKTTGTRVVVEEKSFLDVPVSTCVERDLKRCNSVGSKVILDMARNANLLKVSVKNTSNPEGRKAYIFDIDGTIALFNNRSPYDYTKVDTDLVREDVVHLLKILEIQHDIILVSGRDGSSEQMTREWLEKNSIPYDVLLMRTPGDSRSDDIVKKEIYKNKIMDKYNVLGVFDDRPRVLRIWRELGLTVFDVGDGIEF